MSQGQNHQVKTLVLAAPADFARCTGRWEVVQRRLSGWLSEVPPPDIPSKSRDDIDTRNSFHHGGRWRLDLLLSTDFPEGDRREEGFFSYPPVPPAKSRPRRRDPGA